jgi:hypothetical protein
MLRDYLRLFKIIHIFLKARVDVDIEAFNTSRLLKVFFLVSPCRYEPSLSLRLFIILGGCPCPDPGPTHMVPT